MDAVERLEWLVRLAALGCDGNVAPLASRATDASRRFKPLLGAVLVLAVAPLDAVRPLRGSPARAPLPTLEPELRRQASLDSDSVPLRVPATPPVGRPSRDSVAESGGDGGSVPR